jgi:hypothetical protein
VDLSAAARRGRRHEPHRSCSLAAGVQTQLPHIFRKLEVGDRAAAVGEPTGVISSAGASIRTSSTGIRRPAVQPG